MFKTKCFKHLNSACSYMSSSDGAPSSGLVPATPTPEGGPLGDTMMPADVFCADIEPAKEIAVENSSGQLIGRQGTAAVPGKCDPPFRSRFYKR